MKPENEMPVRKCKLGSCREEFRAKRHDQVFCSGRCRQTYHRRIERRGARAYELLLEWRRTRGKKGILTKIAAEVDGWLKEDKEEAS